MWEDVSKARIYFENRLSVRPEIAIILGTGLGNLAREIEITEEFAYSGIPGFKTSTVEGHSGKLLFGTLAGVPVMAMKGRFHYYEGYSMQEVTFPVRLMKQLGIKTLIVSNAAGGLNPDFVPGDIMLITDHINLFPENPLRGKNDDRFGARFPDMSKAYDRELIRKAENIAASHHISLRKGVYVGTQGPTYETLAEYRFFRIIGGDTVGMSTVPEVIVANHVGISCFGISVVGNVGLDASLSSVTHEEVQENTRTAQQKLNVLVREMVKEIGKA
ncbi:MAG: purine-nucleoside phosphorylase [Prevotellaceae bacterium]|jgi:purine-nucleoside phosphorylase|nr:purine-nucleoside phosphorylase [Prevotellaceae bacterium]